MSKQSTPVKKPGITSKTKPDKKFGSKAVTQSYEAPQKRGVDVFIGNFALNGDKNIYIALTGIMGIGRSTSEKICKNLQINLYTKAKLLESEDLARINSYIKDKNIIVGDKFRAQETARYKRLSVIRSNRFLRFMAGLKNNGQTVRRRSKSCDSNLARIRALGFI
jgi:small subunit ribosomal protein S13